MMGLDNTMGLNDYLSGVCSPPEVFYKTSLPNLAFMPAGPLPPNAADILASPHLLTLLSIGREVFDLIILDGPPVMGLADALLLANAAEATILIVGAGQVRSRHIKAAVQRLALARSNVIGAALTKCDTAWAGYDGYGHPYGTLRNGTENVERITEHNS
jgi:capsular exopolysaccharide synthesis family protein